MKSRTFIADDVYGFIHEGSEFLHLCMVELKRDSQCPFPPMPFVFAPNQKRIIEHTAIHAYCPVYLIPGKGRRTNHHAIRQIMVLAAFGNLLRQS